MKALSIQQPWAYVIVAGFKDIENRTWPTRFRGDFLVHAGQRFDREGLLWIRKHFPRIRLPLSPDEYERGGIVGRARLVDCVSTSNSPWFFGAPYGFVLADISRLPFHPMKGRLGFFEVKLDG